MLISAASKIDRTASIKQLNDTEPQNVIALKMSKSIKCISDRVVLYNPYFFDMPILKWRGFIPDSKRFND